MATLTNGRRAEVREIVRAKRGIILDLGCGDEKQRGAVGMDVRDLPNVDVVHDWNDFPWPFEDESVLTIIASHVVEHVPRRDGFHFIDWMNECWRVLKPGGQMAIVSPYGLSTFYVQDPTHVNPITERTFWYFDGEQYEMHGGTMVIYWHMYKPRPWKLEHWFFSNEGMLEVSLRKRPEVPENWLTDPASVKREEDTRWVQR